MDHLDNQHSPDSELAELLRKIAIAEGEAKLAEAHARVAEAGARNKQAQLAFRKAEQEINAAARR